MIQEEKAKAYDKALEQARNELNTCGSLNCDAARQIFRLFPELKENDDEKIRKELIEIVNSLGTGVIPIPENREEMLAYLEKQKEQTRNIIANLLDDGITGVQRELIEFLSNNIDTSWVDVIKSSDAYAQRIRSMFEKQKEQKPSIKEPKYESFEDGNATGWRIKKKTAEYGDDVVEEAEEYTSKVDCGEYGVAVTEAYIAGVLSERNRKPAEWSKEDEMNLYNIIEAIKYTFDVSEGSSGSHLITWLKFHLRPQPHWKPNDQ